MKIHANSHKFLSQEQESYLCEIIDLWYLEWKDKITVKGQPDLSRLGVAKEQLKMRVCGDDNG